MARFWRKYHRWISVIITIPFLLTLCTGMLLLFRGQSTWISPKYPSASGELKISFDEILTAAQSVPELQVKTWKDVGRIDIRPESGAITVRAKNSNFEAAIDGATGKVLGVGERMSSLLVSLHEGTYFGLGNIGRFSITFPMTLGVLFLIISGVVIFFQPLLLKRRKK
ncbi:PepSY domain-containing protein [Bdellovibrio bacteriovorus]|uniref:PepSY domain-containing protein n=1 Tax=Bdellovibrio TaxID=958 RepID=UPI0035A98C87